VRAAAGLAATVLDEALKLPRELPGLPVRVLGLAMQTSLRLQQQYSGLVARGDELFTGLLGDNEPGMATFDDDETPLVADPPARPGGLGSRTSSFDLVADVPAGAEEDGTDELLDDLADDVAEELALDDELAIADEAVADLAVVADQPTTDDSADIADDVVVAAAVEDLTGDPVLAEDPVHSADEAQPTDSPSVDELVAAVAPTLDEDAEIDARAAHRGQDLTDDVVEALPDDPIADAVIDAVEEVADEIGLEAPLDDRVKAAEESLEHAHDRPAEDPTPADAAAGEPTPEAVLDPVAETADEVTEVADDLADLPSTEDVVAGSEGAPLGDAADGADGALGTDAIADSTPTTEAPATDAAAEADAAPAAEATDTLSDDAPVAAAPVADEAPEASDAESSDDAATDDAATEDAATDTATDDTATDDEATDDEREPEVAAGTHSEPVEGYDQFSIASLRGHLRGYSLETVEQLLSYEEATRGRQPYVTMLQNRIKRLQSDS